MRWSRGRGGGAPVGGGGGEEGGGWEGLLSDHGGPGSPGTKGLKPNLSETDTKTIT